MPRPTSNQGRARLLLSWLLIPALWSSASPLSGQELPLKREVPGLGPYACPAVPVTDSPGGEERAQARELASTAAQSVILGDLERARDLLERATALDPSSAELAYRYARVLEDMGELEAAASEFCRVLAVNPRAEGVVDARARLETLADPSEAPYPPEAISEFEKGIRWVDAGFLSSALASFDFVTSLAPDWPEAVFDRGVVASRLGRTTDAIQDLRRYLELQPDAPDAAAVSRRISELQIAALASTPSPTGALALGVLFPGMGQLYSGRPLGGLAVAALAGGAAAVGYFVTESAMFCSVDRLPDGSCPEGRLRRGDDRPYLVAGLASAGGIGLIGAIEAFVHLRRRRSPDAGIGSMQLGGARLSALDVAPSGGSLELRVIRLTF
jgi:tetratricopeptide (TPR) repeat protein